MRIKGRERRGVNCKSKNKQNRKGESTRLWTRLIGGIVGLCATKGRSVRAR